MSRSLKKGPYVDEKLLKKVKELKRGDKTIIKTWSRACVITQKWLVLLLGFIMARNI